MIWYLGLIDHFMSFFFFPIYLYSYEFLRTLNGAVFLMRGHLNAVLFQWAWSQNAPLQQLWMSQKKAYIGIMENETLQLINKQNK